ncbi:hypothetical protein KUTeg_016531, partial [Tegillarca granosa]
MSDSEKLLESDQDNGGTHNHRGNTSAQLNTDLADTFQLFKSYLDGKISTLHKELAVGNESFAKKLKQEVTTKLKGEVRNNNSSSPFVSTDVKNQLHMTSATDVTNLVTGGIVAPSLIQGPAQQSQESDSVKDEYHYFACLYENSLLLDQFQMFIEHVHFFEKIDIAST